MILAVGQRKKWELNHIISPFTFFSYVPFSLPLLKEEYKI